MYRKSNFTVDGEFEKLIVGYTKGERWNGWACPRFTKENAMKVIEHFSSDTYNAWYDEAKDRFIFKMEHNAPPFEDIPLSELEEQIMYNIFEGEDISINDKLVRVYPIGAWCWIWDEWSDEELSARGIDNPNAPSSL